MSAATRWILSLLCCWLSFACSSPDGASNPNAGSKGLGERCQSTEECASSLCVRLDDGGGICSKSCEAARDCPASDNWDCLGAPGQPFSVCACLPLAEREVCGDGLDNDCNGSVDDCRTCDGATVPLGDDENCGACGVACRPDQKCDGKTCVCPKATPDECGGACTKLTTDTQNCGECGKACAPGQACVGGECVCDEAGKGDFCPDAGCVSWDTDLENCGGCGQKCTLGQSCVAGRCACPAGGPRDFCADVGCVDLKTDVKRCGACGNACDEGQSCVSGKCECPAGQSSCNGKCVDLATDERNCGACDQLCPDGQACANGACGCTGPGLTSCGADCADLRNDVDNCGTCGDVCAEGEQCNGSCECRSGVYCGTTCVPEDDSQNCGACGNACSDAQVCNDGRCECAGFGVTKCGAACYDLGSDREHCGSCERACRTGESCIAGDCQCASYGQTYCAAASKCVSLSTDAANCGVCGNACKPSEACVAGECTCPQAGQEYCAAEGKCVDTSSSTANCGACGVKCKTSEVCSAGTCACPGATQGYCASASTCVDLWTDGKHCGGCDKACPSGTQCAYGACRCPSNDDSICGSACVNLQTSVANCGSCGTACGTGEACTSGQCRCPAPSVGAAVRLTENELVETGAVAAWDGTHVGVAYFRQIAVTSTYFNLRFALLNADGSLFKDVALTSYADGDFRGAARSFSSDSNGVTDTLGITWNGAEFAVVWDDYAPSTNDLKMVRVSSAGVPSSPVTVVSNQETHVVGPSVTWSVPYDGYIVTGAERSAARAYYRRVGPQGLTLQPANGYPASSCHGTSTATSPLGVTAVSCYAFATTLGIFNADGSRTLPLQSLGPLFTISAPETLWDGTTFDTTILGNGGIVWLFRDGSPSFQELLASDDAVGRSAFATAWVGGSLALGTVEKKTLALRRFRLSTDANAVPTSPHAPVTVVPTANVLGKPALARAGANKLLAIWQDDRWGSRGELFAAPIDLKGCP